MFDIGWSELMILGIVALIVVGPKDLPILLRTIGRYTGMLKKQASEFRHQFDEAIREAELDQLKKDVTSFKDDMESAVRDSARSFNDEMDSAKRQLEIPELDDPDAHDANGIPIHRPAAQPASTVTSVENSRAATGVAGDASTAQPAPASAGSDSAIGVAPPHAGAGNVGADTAAKSGA